ELSVSPHIYEPIAIERGDIDVSQGKGECTITMPLNKEPASMFALFNPPGVLWVTVMRYPAMHVLFVGKIVKCSPKLSAGKAELKAISLQSVLAGSIPNKTFSVSCEHDVFDADCAANKAAFTLTMNLGTFTMPDSMTLQSATFDAYADGYFNGGLVASGMEGSFVISHVGDTLSLMYPLQTVLDQSFITIEPGCNKVISICRNKFNNEVNFGGCAWIPNTNLTTQGW
ncbi:MAG TPA: phage BR0599 family protein, partial [Dissulfurispiraceae bacterium]|nr:phage BR0599 family protein [Dissulfurispiraceae bacterium]